MRSAIVIAGLLTSSLAFAQERPGGPRILEELDAMTSTTSTGAPPLDALPGKRPMERRRGILGINVVNLSGQVRVKSIKPNGPAQKAGIEKWDTILSIDGEPVKDRRDYVAYMAGKYAGDRVLVEWRANDGSVRSSAIDLGAGRRLIVEDDDRPKRRRRVRKARVRTRKWYGWQVIASDVASLILVAFTGESAIAGGLGLVGYGIGAPITHFFHDNLGRGFLSMGLRVGIPALTVLGTIGLCDEARVCDDASPLVVIGALATFIAIPAVDAAALSWQRLEPARETSVNVSLVPAVAPTDEGGMTFGLGGTF